MKKFKVIEEGRFVNKDEMGNIKGGYIDVCTNFATCSSVGYTICVPGAALGYVTTNLCASQETHTTCSSGYIYMSCMNSIYGVCPSTKFYFS